MPNTTNRSSVKSRNSTGFYHTKVTSIKLAKKDALSPFKVNDPVVFSPPQKSRN